VFLAGLVKLFVFAFRNPSHFTSQKWWRLSPGLPDGQLLLNQAVLVGSGWVDVARK
jgi:hypothetical protein